MDNYSIATAQVTGRVPRLFSDDRISDDHVSDEHISEGRISDERIKWALFLTPMKYTIFPTEQPKSVGEGDGAP